MHVVHLTYLTVSIEYVDVYVCLCKEHNWDGWHVYGLLVATIIIVSIVSLNDNLFENSSHETLVEMCAAMSMYIQTWISRFENTNMILKIALNRVLLATTLRYIIKYIRARNKTGFNQPKKIFTTCFCHRNTIYFKLRMHHSWVDILILRINVSNHDFFLFSKK